jgi:glycosyltransferase involved in cell wall biosynthesis
MNAMGMFDHAVTYTNFAKKEAILANPSMANRLDVIYHGVNTNDFYPLPKDDVEAFRRQYFGQHAGKYVVSNINRNQQRKDIPRTIAAFKEFKNRRPNSVLYLHMAHKDQGWNLPEVIQAYGLRLGEDVLLPGGDFGPNQGFPLEIVNLIYNASNVIVSTTLGEGWGLSSTEAMACRKPIIFPNNTSLTEIVGEDRGLLADSGEDSTVLPNDNEVVRPLTSVPSLVEKLLYAHDNREEMAKLAENGYNWVKNNLTWDKHIAPKWDKLFQKATLDMVKNSAKPGIISAEDL